MAKKETTPAVAPALLTVRVLLAGANEPVKGLFVAFKLATPQTAKLARVIETIHEDEFKEKRYKHLLAQYQAQQAETVADPSDQYVLGITDIDGYLEPVYDSSNPWRDRHARLEPDTFKFAAGERYTALYIRHPSPDVARAVTRLLNTKDSGRADVDFATPLQTFTVENGSGVDGEQFVIHVPAQPQAYVPVRKDDPAKWWLYAGMPHENVESVRQQVRELVDSLGQLKYPATGDQDTPYSVTAVDHAIEVTRNSKGMDEKAKQTRINSLTAALHTFHGPLQAVAARFQEHLAEGRAFQPVDWAKAHDASLWASEIGVPVKTAPAFTPRLEAGGVIGPHTANALNEWLKQKWVKPPQHLITIGNGVLMLARGAFAFNAWSELAKVFGCDYGMSSGHSYRQLMAEGGGGAIKNSIHKTGLASDMTGGRQRTSSEKWPIRFEAEFRRLAGDADLSALEAALNEKKAALTEAERQREADRQTAATEVTNAEKAKADLVNPKKPQLAAADKRIRDAQKALTGIDKKHEPKIARATKDRDAAQANLDNAKKAIQTDGYRLPDRWRMRFRLYGHSTFDVFHNTDAEMKRLKAAIAQWAGTHANSGLDGGFIAFLKKTYLPGLDSPLVDDWLSQQFAPVFAFTQELLALPDKDIIDRYFRATVNQWRVNFYELDGGSDSLKPQAPTDGDTDLLARPDAKSWLNLSALGHGCQMHRIQPHKWETRDRTSFAKDPEKVPPMSFPMDAYLSFEGNKGEQGDLVAAIEDITATHAQAPELAHPKYKIEFRQPTGKKKETEVAETAMPDEINTAFFKEWRRKLFPWKKKKAPVYLPGGKGVYGPRGAQLSITLNELDPTRQQALQEVFALFNGFPDERFVVLESGNIVDDELPQNKFFTGKELAAAARSVLSRLTAEATAKKAAEPAPDKKSKKKLKRSDLPKPPKIKVEDWSFLVQPVFTHKGDKLLFLPDHIVILPYRENAAHLEWWHFQHNSVKEAKNWSELLEECGYSRAVMRTPAEGAHDPAGEPVHLGLGYTEGKGGELDSTPWPNPKEIAERPSNYDSVTDEAVEEELAYIE